MNIRKQICVSLAAASALLVSGSSNPVRAASTSNMQAALTILRQARINVVNIKDEYQGLRVFALQNINFAIRNLEQVLKSSGNISLVIPSSASPEPVVNGNVDPYAKAALHNLQRVRQKLGSASRPDPVREVAQAQKNVKFAILNMERLISSELSALPAVKRTTVNPNFLLAVDNLRQCRADLQTLGELLNNSQKKALIHLATAIVNMENGLRIVKQSFQSYTAEPRSKPSIEQVLNDLKKDREYLATKDSTDFHGYRMLALQQTKRAIQALKLSSD